MKYLIIILFAFILSGCYTQRTVTEYRPAEVVYYDTTPSYYGLEYRYYSSLYSSRVIHRPYYYNGGRDWFRYYAYNPYRPVYVTNRYYNQRPVTVNQPRKSGVNRATPNQTITNRTRADVNRSRAVVQQPTRVEQRQRVRTQPQAQPQRTRTQPQRVQPQRTRTQPQRVQPQAQPQRQQPTERRRTSDNRNRERGN